MFGSTGWPNGYKTPTVAWHPRKVGEDPIERPEQSKRRRDEHGRWSTGYWTESPHQRCRGPHQDAADGRYVGELQSGPLNQILQPRTAITPADVAAILDAATQMPALSVEGRVVVGGAR